jgi:hypothetical protein
LLYSSSFITAIRAPSPDAAALAAAHLAPGGTLCSTDAARAAVFGAPAPAPPPAWRVDLDAMIAPAGEPTVSARLYASLGEWVQVVAVPAGGSGVRRAGTWGSTTLYASSCDIVVTAPRLYDAKVVGTSQAGPLIVPQGEQLVIPRFASYLVSPATRCFAARVVFVEHLVGCAPYIALQRASRALLASGDPGAAVAVLADYAALLAANALGAFNAVPWAGALDDARAALPAQPAALQVLAGWSGRTRAAAASVAAEAARRRDQFTDAAAAAAASAAAAVAK